MLWFKHISKSTSDPDLLTGIMRYGADAYFVYFNTLEVLSREDAVDVPLSMDFKAFAEYFPTVSKKKLATILAYFASDERQKKRFYLRKNEKNLYFFDENFTIYSYKLSDISGTYTKKVRSKLKQKPALRRKKKEERSIKKTTTKKRGGAGKKLTGYMPFTINNQKIKKSFYYTLVKLYGDWNAKRYLYRARKAKNIEAYIKGGLVDKDGELGYIKIARADESDDPKKVNRWINTIIDLKPPAARKPVEVFETDATGKKKKEDPKPLTDILNDMNIKKKKEGGNSAKS